MAVKISGKYLGDKRVEALHEQSGSTLVTDAPLDNQGLGRAFSPTDLFATSIGVCALTVMSIYAERNNIPLDGSHFELEKEMSANPRRVASVVLTFHLPKSLSPEVRQKLETVAGTCPVRHSLHPEVQTPTTFSYDVE